MNSLVVGKVKFNQKVGNRLETCFDQNSKGLEIAL
jgi:hypothetical protein